MLTRRTLLLSSLAVMALTVGARAQSAAPSPQQATQLIDQTAKRLIAVIDGPGSADQKRPALQQIVDNVVAVDEIGQFCLGRHWRTASPQQQRDYLGYKYALFHGVFLLRVSARVISGRARASASRLA